MVTLTTQTSVATLINNRVDDLLLKINALVLALSGTVVG